MDKHRGVEARRGEDGTILGMRPGKLVDGAGVAGEGGVVGVGVAGYVVDFDGAVFYIIFYYMIDRIQGLGYENSHLFGGGKRSHVVRIEKKHWTS